MQKSTISKEELKSVCNLLLSKDSLTAEPRPPVLIADTSVSDNTSAPSNTEEPREEIQNHDSSVSDMDEEFLSVLFNLQNAEPDTQHEIGNPIVKSEGFPNKATATDEGRSQGSFCSKTVFNLSQRVLSEIEIQVLEKALDFAPNQKSINENELRKDFEYFSRRMRIRWNFRDQPSEDFSDKPAFRPKSNWKHPPGHPGLELFLSQLEKEIFNGLLNDSISIPSNMSKEEWEALRGLADDRSIVIKQADKGSCVVVWCRDDYIKEANKQLEAKTVNKDINFKETILSDLVDKSNRIFKSLYTHKFITEKELKYFSYDFGFQKTANLGKLNLLPKIHKRLYNVPGRPVISNCGTPTEKASEFLDFYLKSLMQSGWSYIRDPGDFIDKMKRTGKVPEGSLLVTADVVSLYPGIAHKEGILTSKSKLEEQTTSKIPTKDLVKLAEFVLQSNFFEFNNEIKQQISGTAIGTKFAAPYACVYMDKTETDLLKTQELQPFVWLRHIDYIFFISTHVEAEL